MKDCCVSFPCCHPESCMPGLRGEVRLEEPATGNLHGGVCEGGEFLGGHGEPKRARNWKRWKQPRAAYSLPGSPLLGNRWRPTVGHDFPGRCAKSVTAACDRAPCICLRWSPRCRCRV